MKSEESSSRKFPRVGIVSVAPLPLYGPSIEGLRPFTLSPLASELVRLGVENKELEELRLEGGGRQLNDSGLGEEELGSSGDVGMAGQEGELRTPQEVAGLVGKGVLAAEAEAGQAEVCPPESKAGEEQAAAKEDPEPGVGEEFLLLELEKGGVKEREELWGGRS